MERSLTSPMSEAKNNEIINRILTNKSLPLYVDNRKNPHKEAANEHPSRIHRLFD